MPNLKIDKDCCGCTACASICGHAAITMEPDSLGFRYPKVDYSKCVECGLCEKVCSFTEEYETPENFATPIPYGVRLKDIDEVMKSRSGGAFVAFSDWVLGKKGIVYGVGYEGHFVVTHKRATTQTERDEFRGSKYVQSDLTGIFKQVRSDLIDGKWVLFSGTPCQVSGLQSFIPDKLKTKLLTVDIVCHGVPSPQIWKEYLKFVEKKEHAKINKVDFRNKRDFGWRGHKESLIFENPSKVTNSDVYTYLFYNHIMLRSSCENCHYCNLRRPADLTLADFWGWEKTGNKLNEDDKGLSLVLVSTRKGKSIFDDVNVKFDMFSPRLEDCMQGHLQYPTKLNTLSGQFKIDFENHGFEYVLKKYGNVGIKYKVKKIIGNVISKIKKSLR